MIFSFAYLELLPLLVTGLLAAGIVTRQSPASWPVFPWLTTALFIIFFISINSFLEPLIELGVVLAGFGLLVLVSRIHWLSVATTFGLLFLQDFRGLLLHSPLAQSWSGFSYFMFRLQDALHFRFARPEKREDSFKQGNRPEGRKSTPDVRPLIGVFAFTSLLAGPVIMAGNWRIYTKPFTFKSIFYRRALWLVLLGYIKTRFLQDWWQMHYERGVLLPFRYNLDGLINLLQTGLYQYVNLYLDFSGYTDIAVGLSALLGLRIKHNFNKPWMAYSLSDFWRRWHITLADWIKVHVYIPLGGSRRGPARWALHILLCMTLIGVWHGLSWHFFTWGLMHGLYMVLERATARLDQISTIHQKHSWLQYIRVGFGWLATQLFVMLGWVVFFWK